MKSLSHRALLTVLLACAIAPDVHAQAPRRDPLRVLRFLPAGLASPTDSLVIAFDHPVSPRLDHSVDSEGFVRIEPTVRTTAYWRDPSTIVVKFAEPLPLGARYRVSIARSLRSADGAPLAEGQDRELRVRPPGLIRFLPSGGELRPDAWQRPWAVYSGPVPLGSIGGHLITAGDPACGTSRAIPLRADSIRPILTTDPVEIREARHYSGNQRLDSLRRVVRFTAADSVPNGCYATARLPVVPGGEERAVGQLIVPARFAVRDVRCPTVPCEGGNLVVSFTRPVRGSEIEDHVRVGGARAALSPSSVGRGQTSAWWPLQQIVLPGREVVVTIDGALVDAAGQPLGADVRRVVRAVHLPPQVEFLAGPVIVPRDREMLFAVRHRNTDSIVVAIGRVADSLRPGLLRRRYYGHQESHTRMEPDSIVRVVATRAPMDSTATFVVPASWLPGAWRDEPVLLLRAWPRRQAREQRIDRWTGYAVISRTTLAAHVLRGHGTLDVLVTSLRDASPVAGARVRFLERGKRELAAGVTDARGRGHLTYRPPATSGWEEGALVEVSARGERTLLTLPAYGARSRAPEDSGDGSVHHGRRSGGDLPDGRVLHGVAFGDRDMYRPGERVHLKGMVRTSRPGGEFVTPAGDSVRWTFAMVGDDDSAERIGRTTSVLSPFGTSDARFELPRTGKLGTYVATLAYKSNASWRVAATAELRVAEYRPVEFVVALDADTTVALFAGDTARMRATSRYLFGMPMDGGALAWNAHVAQYDYWNVARPPALEGFNVGRSWWRLGSAARQPQVQTASGKATLASDGGASIVVPIGPVTGPSQLVVSAGVTDANRQTVTSDRRLTVHAADAYVGVRVRPWRWLVNSGEPVPLELQVVRADGSRRPGTPVELSAVRYEWKTNGQRADTVWRSRAASADTVVRVPFTPTSAGWYEVLATVSDEKGRTATTGYHLWVSGSTETSRTLSGITITMDRESYTPGDTAVAVIESADERRAWVTLSTSTPLVEQQVVLRRGSNVVRIPMPVAAMPTARLGVIALRPVPRDGARTDTYFTNTEQWISVATSPRALDVRVSPERTRYAPGDTVTLHVRVRDAASRGRRAEATLWAVDQGVAALTDLQKPELLEPLLRGGDAVSAASTLSVPVLSSLGGWPADMVTVRIRGLSSNTALEGIVVTGYGESRRMSITGATAAVSTGVGTEVLRTVFATTPFWNGSVVTDAAGNATTRFVLPHNVTTFRLFSAAITAGTEVGSGDTSLVATRPLLVRAALPRTVRLGDTLLAGGVITQDTSARTPVQLAIETRGIDVSAARTRRDTLDGRRARELRFPMRVTAGDSVSVTLRAEGGGHADAVRTTLPVSPAGHARAHVVMGTLEGRADVALPAVDGIDPDRSRVALQLGVSPLGIVRQLDHTLRIYPYYCTEQVTSAARGLLARRTLEQAVDGESILAPPDREQLERAVSIIVSRQREDGSIGYWHASDWSSPWLTSYAVSMLLDARDAGISVPAATLTRAADYLVQGRDARTTMGWVSAPDASSHDMLAAMRILRRVGLSDTLLERSLRSRVDQLDLVDRLDYAMLRAERGDTAGAREMLREAWRATRVEGRLVRVPESVNHRGWLFPSSVRTAARLFTATATFDPRHPQLGALFESIVQGQRSGARRQWNTVEQVEVAEAIVAARAIFRFGEARTVVVRSGSGATLATSRFASGRSDSASFVLSALAPTRGDSPARLALEADSPAPIYYAATLLETPRARPVRADDEGIGVERWYESYTTGKPLTSVREGELVRVRLRVIVPRDRDFVAVTDPLPAGLEAVDLSLRTSSTLAPFAGAPRQEGRSGDSAPGGRWMYGSWDAGWWTPWDHKEIRDDRVHWFARRLWTGTFEISYVARATTAGAFVRPPAYAEEMYNPGVRGRSDGGWFTVTSAR